jgi:predicted Zn-dependent protease
MNRNRLYLTLILAVPVAAAVGWWFYYPHYRLWQAERALAAADLDRAEGLLRHITRQRPTSYRPYYLYAQALRRLKRPAEAQTALLLAVRHGLPEADGRREFALAEAEKSFTPNAEANLRDVLRERPGDAEVVRALAEGYAAQHRWQDADDCYTRLLEAEPGRVDTLLERGKLRLTATGYQFGRPAAAADDFREVLRHRPDDFDAHLYLAHSLISDARMADARDELLVCRRQRPARVEPLIGLAACAVEGRDWQQAEALLREALQVDPKSVYALGKMGDLYVRRQQFREAITYFRRVLELEPKNAGAHLKLAQAYRFLGDEAQAGEQERLYQRMKEEKELE